MPWAKVTPVELRCLPGDLCQRPYPGHRKGCPNYGKRDTCPPKAAHLLLTRMPWGMETKWYAVWNKFPFGEHVAKMRKFHPDWSQRQLECCLYWQGAARKQLRVEVGRFLKYILSKSYIIWYTPEAAKVDVTRTMQQLEVQLEWPPKTVAYQVALVAVGE